MISNRNLGVIEKYKNHRLSLGKAENTVKTDINAVRKIAKCLGKKNFDKASEDDLKTFFIEQKNFILRDHYASKIICFYKWLLKLDGSVRPSMMAWYRYSNSSNREKQKDPNIKKELLEAEEYAKIIQHVRADLRMSALYETLYLSGARPDEVCKMKVGHVVNDSGKISVLVTDSKTIPREIPLTEKPSLLLRWLENHPEKTVVDAWLFPSLDRRFKNRHIEAGSLSDKFKKLVVRLELKDTLILYSFRKTRATIMFNQAYDDKEMGMLFGWKPHTVIDRRNEYDLRGMEDLKLKVFQKADIYKTREQLEGENKKITGDFQQRIDVLEKQNAVIGKLFLKMMNSTLNTGVSVDFEVEGVEPGKLIDFAEKMAEMLDKVDSVDNEKQKKMEPKISKK
ncbi:MAG: tyrosine-type recombinase/integrase [Thermoplasmata archaeon]|nr:tyrosine-type recombinase/integrase [Thermoplasmata archaeon]